MLGEEAVTQLKSLGYDAAYRNLDISDELSIGRFARNLEEEFGKIDILVNNAAIAFKGSDPTPFVEQAHATVQPNFFGTLMVTQALYPLLLKSDSARIVNVASQAGHLRILKSDELRARFVDCKSIGELEDLMNNFVADVQQGVHESKGWPNSNYGVSKLGVIALTRLLARQAAEDRSRAGAGAGAGSFLVNCCCPGYCATDMSSHKGSRSAEHGARTPAMLALAADDSATGKFFYDEAELEW